MNTNTQKETCYQKNRDKFLQKSKDYYESNKEQWKKYRRNKYNNMTDEERLKVLEYRKEWYHKSDLERKRKMSEYSKNRYSIRVNKKLILLKSISLKSIDMSFITIDTYKLTIFV